MWLIGDQKTVSGVPHRLDQGEVTIGRSRDAQIRIRDSSVSRLHAKLVVLGTTITVLDLDSSNGILINQRRVAKGQLQPGDVLMIGAVPTMLAASPLSEIPILESTVRIEANQKSRDLPASEQLTPRQKEVLQLLLEGGDEKQIAAKLGCKPRTAHNHIQEIYREYQVHSRQQLLVKFIRISPQD